MCKLSYNLLAPIPALSAVRWEINCLGWQEWMRKRQWRTAPLLQACMWANKPLPLYVMPPRGCHTVSESSAALPHCKSLSAQAWRLLPEGASPRHSHYLQRQEAGLSTQFSRREVAKIISYEDYRSRDCTTHSQQEKAVNSPTCKAHHSPHLSRALHCWGHQTEPSRAADSINTYLYCHL